MSLDTDSMQPSDSEQLQSIINGVNFFKLPNQMDGKKGTADYFHYKITLETNDNKHTVETTDVSMPPKFKDLVNFLSKHCTRTPNVK